MGGTLSSGCAVELSSSETCVTDVCRPEVWHFENLRVQEPCAPCKVHTELQKRASLMQGCRKSSKTRPISSIEEFEKNALPDIQLQPVQSRSAFKKAAMSTLGLKQETGDDYFGPPTIKISQRPADEDLLLGSMRGEINQIRKGLSSGAAVTLTNVRGLTALHLVAGSSGPDSIEAAQTLLSSRAELHIRDGNGWTCLHHACRNGRTEMVKHLLTLKAEPGMLTSDGRSVLMLATMEGKVELVQDLLKWRGAVGRMLSDKDFTGCTALHYAARGGDLEVVTALVNKSAKINAKDSDGKDSLMWACIHRRLLCVKFLLKKQADLQVKCKNNNTPLIYACMAGSDAIATCLMDRNSDPNIKAGNGQTVEELAEALNLIQFKIALKNLRLQQTIAEETRRCSSNVVHT